MALVGKKVPATHTTKVQYNLLSQPHGRIETKGDEGWQMLYILPKRVDAIYWTTAVSAWNSSGLRGGDGGRAHTARSTYNFMFVYVLESILRFVCVEGTSHLVWSERVKRGIVLTVELTTHFKHTHISLQTIWSNTHTHTHMCINIIASHRRRFHSIQMQTQSSLNAYLSAWNKSVYLTQISGVKLKQEIDVNSSIWLIDWIRVKYRFWWKKNTFFVCQNLI